MHLRAKRVGLALVAIAALPILAVAAVWLLPLEWGEICGQTQAHIDASRGHYKIVEAGLPLPSRDEFNEQLKKQFGIDSEVRYGCIISQYGAGYLRGYSSVMDAAIIRHFGRDVVQQTEESVAGNGRESSSALR